MMKNVFDSLKKKGLYRAGFSFRAEAEQRVAERIHFFNFHHISHPKNGLAPIEIRGKTVENAFVLQWGFDGAFFRLLVGKGLLFCLLFGEGFPPLWAILRSARRRVRA